MCDILYKVENKGRLESHKKRQKAFSKTMHLSILLLHISLIFLKKKSRNSLITYLKIIS